MLKDELPDQPSMQVSIEAMSMLQDSDAQNENGTSDEKVGNAFCTALSKDLPFCFPERLS
jgi:hypothetical protein